MSFLSESYPSGNLNLVLDDGTIVGQSPMRGGHPDCETQEPSPVEIDAFMADVQREQAAAIVAAEFEEQCAASVRYAKRYYPDAMLSINRTASMTTILNELHEGYAVVILNPQFETIGEGTGPTMRDALSLAVSMMMDNDFQPRKPAAA